MVSMTVKNVIATIFFIVEPLSVTVHGVLECWSDGMCQRITTWRIKRFLQYIHDLGNTIKIPPCPPLKRGNSKKSPFCKGGFWIGGCSFTIQDPILHYLTAGRSAFNTCSYFLGAERLSVCVPTQSMGTRINPSPLLGFIQHPETSIQHLVIFCTKL